VIIYLVTDSRGTAASIQHLVARQGPGVELRLSRRVPSPARHDDDVLTVLDLTESNVKYLAPPDRTRQPGHYLAITRPRLRLPMRWFDFLRGDGVKVFTVSSTKSAMLLEVLAHIEACLEAVSVDEIADAVIRADPTIAPMRALVRAVLRDPWSIRHPRDLQLHARLVTDQVANLCRAAGIRRMEHFITKVRALALEYLINTRRLPVRRARMLVGVRNSSNFRRQMRRSHARVYA
jgi:hypothetical protein